MSRFNSKAVIGLTQEESWSQVITSQNGQLSCAFSIKGPQAQNLGRSISSKLIRAQVNTPVQLHHLVLDLLKTTRETDHHLQLAIALLTKTKLTLASYNGLILFKKQTSSQLKLATILESVGEIKMITGQMEAGSELVLLTAAVKSEITQIKEILLEPDLDTQAEYLEEVIHLSQSSLGAISLLQLDLTQVPAEEEKTEAKPLDQQPETESVPTASPSLWQIIKKVGGKLKIALKSVKQTTQKTLPAVKTGLSKLNKIFFRLKNRPKRKIIRLLVVALIVALTLLGAGFSFITQRRQLRARVAADLKPAQASYQQALEQRSEDVFQARDLVEQSIENYHQLFAQYPDNELAQAMIQEELTKAEQLAVEISGDNQLQNLNIFFDLEEVAANFIVSQADAANNHFYLLDQGQQLIIKLDLTTKEANSLKLADSVQAMDLTATNDQLFLLGDGIYQIELADWSNENQPEIKQVKTQGDSTRLATMIDSFTDYLYVFNPEKRNIYRFVIREDELSEPIGWLTNKQGINFDQIKSMSINGFIWLIDNTGEVTKLFQGEPTEFEPNGLNEPLADNAKLYTHPELEQIYLLDPAQSRVAILNEGGQFIQQISSPSLASANLILVAAKEKQIYPLSGSLIFSLNP